jgi:hypothetical protein
MNYRYRLIRRSSRGGTYYCVDTTTGKRTSLRCNHEEDARQIVHAMNEAERQPRLNLQIAGADSGSNTRTWQQAIDIIITHKRGANRLRWERASPDPSLIKRTWSFVMDAFLERGKEDTRARREGAMRCRPLYTLRDRKLVVTTADHLRAVLNTGNRSTHRFLLCWHNLAVGMGWLPGLKRRTQRRHG